MTTVQNLYSALDKQGISKRKLALLLPEWWTDEVEASPSGVQQAKVYLAKALSLRMRPFSETPPRIEFDLPADKRFKKSAKTSEADVNLAVALARSASRLALSALDTQFAPPPPDALAIREHLLLSGAPWVSLSALLDYCWSIGIPVIHLATPLLGRKMDGIAMAINGRPSIVLSNNRKSGFLLFHLAHELGHIALGHVGANGTIVDDEIKKDGALDKDADELAADQFAIQLLTGNTHGNFKLQQLMKTAMLARLAIQYGKDHKIDPTHIVLNCAHNDKRIFALCVSAANFIAGESTDQEMVTDFVFRQLQENLKDDSEHLLRKLIA
ncbi:ImmA/IrrE family metallo-endopeptidase [Pseudomonas mandelii]|uniref:ImmA/IrrE family metallo-endopeptidase n=1 Tax=Pseudomonas mandelii TaxID=75612 RepID=UPI00209E1D21|nr:ImmA/IrrE family metallo-endopeptidase [Pseudomonas mandelii]MCO8310345.1 ImmA/IrrE family metallo-endopeptidase [Pseudomonas mandelii]